RRDVPVAAAHVVQNGHDAAGAAASSRGEMFEAGARRADDRELRGDEEPIREDKQQDQPECEEDGVHGSASSDDSSFTRLATAVTSARRRTSSTSNSKSPMTTRSRGVGRCPSASVTNPLTVADSVSHFVPRNVAASSTGIWPGSLTRPSGSVSATGSPALNSSPTSP